MKKLPIALGVAAAIGMSPAVFAADTGTATVVGTIDLVCELTVDDSMGQDFDLRDFRLVLGFQTVAEITVNCNDGPGNINVGYSDEEGFVGSNLGDVISYRAHLFPLDWSDPTEDFGNADEWVQSQTKGQMVRLRYRAEQTSSLAARADTYTSVMNVRVIYD